MVHRPVHGFIVYKSRDLSSLPNLAIFQMVMELPHRAKTKSRTAICITRWMKNNDPIVEVNHRTFIFKKKGISLIDITFIVVAGSPEKRALSFNRNSFIYGSINLSTQIASSSPTTYSLVSPTAMPLLLLF